MSRIRIFASIVLATTVAVLIEWQFTRHQYQVLSFLEYSVPLFVGDFWVRVLGCAVGLTVSGFLWGRHRYFVVSGVILLYIVMDAPKIYSYFPIDPHDWYPFKMLPVMWAKITWFMATVVVTVSGSLIGEFVGRLVRKRFVMYSGRHSRSAI